MEQGSYENETPKGYENEYYLLRMLRISATNCFCISLFLFINSSF